MNKYSNAEEIHQRAKEIIGIPFGDIFPKIKQGNKGGLGNLVQEHWFGLKPNSRAEADFPEAGVELKVTPYVVGTKGVISAGERLSLNVFDFTKEANHTFETSSFWTKNNRMEILFYHRDKTIPRSEWFISHALSFTFPSEDLEVIRDDWEKIVSYIKAGKAHELSEGLTDYLGAATKGSKGGNERKQPYSDIPAKQRAFSLKNSYMTHFLRTKIFAQKQVEKVFVTTPVLKEQTLEEAIVARVKEYVGKTVEEIAAMFPKQMGHISLTNKSYNNYLLSPMLGIKGKVQNAEEFVKANILPKTITINAMGTVREGMSFPGFKALELIHETWEESSWRETFETKRFLLAVFEETKKEFNRKTEKQKYTIFKNFYFWNMPPSMIDTTLREEWQVVQAIILNGVKLVPKNSKVHNSFPKQTETKVSHIRPHTGRAPLFITDTNADWLPGGRFMAKQSLWLNPRYIQSQLEVLMGNKPPLY